MATKAEKRFAEMLVKDINMMDRPEEVLETIVKKFFGNNHKKRRKWCWIQASHAEENFWRVLWRKIKK